MSRRWTDREAIRLVEIVEGLSGALYQDTQASKDLPRDVLGASV